MKAYPPAYQVHWSCSFSKLIPFHLQGGWGVIDVSWTSHHIRNIADCACTGNVGNVFPAPTSKKTTNQRSLHASRHVRDARAVMHVGIANQFTGGNRAKLPSSRWRRRGRSLREVFACSRLIATTDLSQICNRVTRGHGTSCTKTTDPYPFSFLYNCLRKIRRETTVGEKPGRR